MTKIDLNKLLDDFNKGKKEIIYYYLIGMWLITNDYNKTGYTIDMMVCKGLSYQEALEEAITYENAIKKIDEQEYIPLTIGESVLEATKNSDYFSHLLWKEEVLPNDERIQKAFDEVINKEAYLNDKNK